jgi:uncharacterized membrane protein YeaQ/YmgE (transglycosylase-associated protein family)
MLAVITRFDIGFLTWTVIGATLGYCVSMFEKDDSPRMLVITLLGLVGGAAGGAITGLILTGHELWETNVAAVAGAALFSVGYRMLVKPRRTDGQQPHAS